MISVSVNESNEMKCYICGNTTDFDCCEGFSFRESICPKCGGSLRNSDLARIIVNTFSTEEAISLSKAARDLSQKKIFETQASGPVHMVLKDCPHYICSEYFDGIPSGLHNENDILCENLMDLSFSDSSFDLIITQDVLEHISIPEKAFSEIFRILKPGGYFVFTIPYHENNPTLRRTVIENGEIINKLPRVYHCDPLREEGALVYTDFGSDLNVIIESQGFIFEEFLCNKWYSPSEIPYIADEKEYQRYKRYIAEDGMLRYFTYNSWVFRARKPGAT